MNFANKNAETRKISSTHINELIYISSDTYLPGY